MPKYSIDFASKSKHATNQTRTINIMAKLSKFQDEENQKKKLQQNTKHDNQINPFS